MTKRFKLGYVCGDYGLVDNAQSKGYKWIDLHPMSENSEKNVQICINKMNALHEENEQLKQAIAETEKMVQSTYDELTKLRCIKNNLNRIKNQWNWIMEAIQYD